MRPANIFLFTPLLLSTTGLAYNIDCSLVVVDKKEFYLKNLRGPHSIHTTEPNHTLTIHNTTWTVDICQPLKKIDDVDANIQCPMGTNVCGIRNIWDPEKDPEQKNVLVDEVIPIAGSLHNSGSSLDAKITRLKQSDSEADGLRIELNGGENTAKRKQKAVIELQCDKERTGNEGNEYQGKFVRRDAEEVPTNTTSSLTFVSYGPVDGKEDIDILRLDWRTKYACEDYEPGDDDDEEAPGKKPSWGFFTWFILLLFLGIAAYLIFGSWLNYNRYGARGWDLLPHGDTIRDVPYIFKDFSRKVLDTFSGGGSRGGYSAV